MFTIFAVKVCVRCGLLGAAEMLDRMKMARRVPAAAFSRHFRREEITSPNASLMTRVSAKKRAFLRDYSSGKTIHVHEMRETKASAVSLIRRLASDLPVCYLGS